MRSSIHIVALVGLMLMAVEAQWAQDASSAPAQATGEETRPTGLPKQVQALLDGVREKIDHHAELAALVNRAEAVYREGEALYQQGKRKAAQAKFAEARHVILSSEEAIFYEPGLHAYFLDLNRQIAALSRAVGLPSLNGSPLPLDLNGPVQAYLRYYQGKGQRSLRTAFKRLDQYEPMMRDIFREEGVPEELIFVGLVESAYNPYAHSPAGASGIWQFVAGTGRRYGLDQTGGLDDRHHPEKSTRAAAQYLRDLYKLFGDWPLALAAYNAGEYRVLKIMQKTGIKDFWQMSRRGLLPQETRNYVPAVLAAMTLGQQRVEPTPALSARPTQSAQSTSSVKRVGKRY